MSLDPQIIEVKLALRQIGPERKGELACDAVEPGYDAPGVLRMAAVIHPSGWEVDRLLPGYMRDAGLEAVSQAEACVPLAHTLARHILESNCDPLPHIKRGNCYLTREFLDESDQPTCCY